MIWGTHGHGSNCEWRRDLLRSCSYPLEHRNCGIFLAFRIRERRCYPRNEMVRIAGWNASGLAEPHYEISSGRCIGDYSR